MLSLVLVATIFWFLLRGIDLGQVWAEIRAMTWLEDAILLAITAWNLATYSLVWEAGLAHRDIKPANLLPDPLVAGGGPWRQQE